MQQNGDILVSTVVGYDNARNVKGGGAGTADGSYDPNQSNDLQNQQFEQNLKALHIKYSKHVVLQIFNWQIDLETPNGTLTPLLILLQNGFDLLSYTDGEGGYRLPLQQLSCGTAGNLGLSTIFVEVPSFDLQRAIDVLSVFRPILEPELAAITPAE
jgi:hypothetical protein